MRSSGGEGARQPAVQGSEAAPWAPHTGCSVNSPGGGNGKLCAHVLVVCVCAHTSGEVCTHECYQLRNSIDTKRGKAGDPGPTQGLLRDLVPSKGVDTTSQGLSLPRQYLLSEFFCFCFLGLHGI